MWFSVARKLSRIHSENVKEAALSIARFGAGKALGARTEEMKDAGKVTHTDVNRSEASSGILGQIIEFFTSHSENEEEGK